MTQHSKLAASGAHRWIPCPGSIRMCAKYPNKSSAAATQGTAAHALAEKMLKASFKGPIDVKKYIGPMKFMDHDVEKTHSVDLEMVLNVKVYVDRVMEHRSIKNAKTFLETRVSLEHIRKDMGGTLDAAILQVNEKKLIIMDYKHGFTPVHVGTNFETANPQLLIYAAGMLELLTNEDIDTVQLEIVQPRCMEVDSVQVLEVEEWRITEWSSHALWEAAVQTEMSDAALNPGDHCKFCPALAECPAVLQQNQAIACSDFDEVPAIPEKVTDLAKIMRAAPMIDAWLRAVEERAFELMNQGQEVDGFKLVRKRANREWPTESPNELFRLIRKAGAKINADDIYCEPKLMSPAMLEKLIGKDIVGKVATKPEAGLTIAAESDRREAVCPAGDFAELL